jgi:acyl-CoA reductase-like NAD-dependent aldehyde dehydrogenase
MGQARAARAAQPEWARTALPRRAAVLEAAARGLAGGAAAMAETLVASTGRPGAAIWSAELIPTLDALRWLARRGPRELASRPLRRSRLQWYFRATGHTLRWEPHGLVGIVSPGNAPLFLGLPQVAAAVLAGNAVLWKPAPSGTAAALDAAALLGRAGLPSALLQIVPGGAEAARSLVDRRGQALLHGRLGRRARALPRTPGAGSRRAELSGRHAAVV